MSRVFVPGSMVDHSFISLKNILIGILIGVIFLAASVIGFTIMIGRLEPTEISVNFSVAIGSQGVTLEWSEYTNSVYGYSIHHPGHIKVYDLSQVSEELSLSSSVLLTNREYSQEAPLSSIPEKSILLIINSRNKEEVGGRELEKVASDIYQTNKPISKSISPLNTTKLGALPAYSFEINKAVSYSSFGSDYMFPNRHIKIILFTDKDGNLHELIYKPTSIAQQIISTLKVKAD